MIDRNKLSLRFQEALTFTTELHVNQRRKISGAPYLGHLLRVTGIVLDHGANEDEAVAALLHDAVEDQGGATTREEIRRRFGSTVVEIVDGCSDTDQSPKPPWRVRKDAYLTRLKTAGPSVRLISAADKLDNVLSLTSSYRKEGEDIWGHFGGGRDGTVWYYRSVVERLQMHDHFPLVEELQRAVSRFEGILA